MGHFIKLTIADIKKRNKEAGFHFFDRDTMRFFASKIESVLYPNMCFVTSEKMGFEATTRKATVRRYCPFTHDIKNVSEFGQFSSLVDARRFARKYE